MSKSRTNDRDDVQKEYDFTGAKRGQFYREGAALIPPVHLEPEILKLLQDRAIARKTTLSGLVNELLRKDIELARLVAEAKDTPPASRKRAGL